MPKRIPTYRHPGPRSTQREYEQQPARAADRNVYSSTRWRRLRAVFLAEHPLCAACLKEGLYTPAAHVHHLIERKDDADKAWDPDNLEALCAPHHSALTMAKNNRDRSQRPPTPA